MGVLALLLVSSYGALSGFAGSVANLDSACEGDACATPAIAFVPQVSVWEREPCPYCDADPHFWLLQTDVPPPELLGRTAAVVEGACGRLIYGRGQDERLPPASLTKIVTALVVVEKAQLNERVSIEINGWDLSATDASSIMGLEAGMKLSVEDLLYGLLLPSGNDAALALADYLGGRESFVEEMNSRVQRLGLRNTFLTNPDGRHDDSMYTSAFDIALLGRELMAQPALRQIVGTETYTPDWSGPLLWNGNYLLYYYAPAIGVKTGHTEEANFTIVGAAERDGRELYAAVLRTSNPYWDVRRLLDWALANTHPACPP